MVTRTDDRLGPIERTMRPCRLDPSNRVPLPALLSPTSDEKQAECRGTRPGGERAQAGISHHRATAGRCGLWRGTPVRTRGCGLARGAHPLRCSVRGSWYGVRHAGRGVYCHRRGVPSVSSIRRGVRHAGRLIRRVRCSDKAGHFGVSGESRGVTGLHRGVRHRRLGVSIRRSGVRNLGCSAQPRRSGVRGKASGICDWARVAFAAGLCRDHGEDLRRTRKATDAKPPVGADTELAAPQVARHVGIGWTQCRSGEAGSWPGAGVCGRGGA